jgi:hypothetical protein
MTKQADLYAQYGLRVPEGGGGGMSGKYALIVFGNAPQVGDKLTVIQSNSAISDGKEATYLTLEVVSIRGDEMSEEKADYATILDAAMSKLTNDAFAKDEPEVCEFCGKPIKVTP